MKIVYLRYFLLPCAAALLVCGAYHQNLTSVHKLKTAKFWSNPATWQGHVPVMGADVDVPKGETVILDTSPPPLQSLTVEGALVFADRNITLSASMVSVSGLLQIGTHTKPFRHHAVVVLTSGPTAPEDKGLLVTGDLEIHGQPNSVDWTHLGRTARAGASQISLSQPCAWKRGDKIAIASTDFDPFEAERETVIGVAGNVVQIAQPLRYTHFGGITDGVDERAEVGLLTRNIVIEGDESSAKDGHGGHIMIMHPGTAHLENAEFLRMGQAGRLGRYPIHFHLAGSLPGAYVRGCSIHDCYNRAVTLHGTNDVLVMNNVAYNIQGHTYFLEDGVETGNRLIDNLGILTRRPAPGKAVLTSDLTPATFWITNPNNMLIGNVAAGSEGDGFWYDLPIQPTGPCATPRNLRLVHPRQTALGVFSCDVAHSNDNDGLLVDNGANPTGVFGAPNYEPPQTAIFSGMTSYKNRRRGLWLRGEHLVVTGARIADNSIGLTLAGAQSVVEDSLFVGKTANGADLPKPDDPHFAVIGYEFYDGQVGASGDTFVNFQPDAQREAGAIGYLRWSPFFVDPRNWITQARFVNANRVYFPSHPTPTDAKDAFKSGGDGYRTAGFVDLDGSVTGTAGEEVMVNTPFLRDAGVTSRPKWGALVSRAPLGRLFVAERNDPSRSMGPVVITRLDDTQPSVTLWGIPADTGPNTNFQTTLLTGHRYRIAFRGLRPSHLRLALSFCHAGQWVSVLVPGRNKPVRLTAMPHGTNPRAIAEIVLPKTGSTGHLKTARMLLSFHSGFGRSPAAFSHAAMSRSS